MTTPANPFLERLEQLKAQQAAKTPAAPTAPAEPDYSQYADSVPTFDKDDTVSQERLELDGVLSNVDIIDGYMKWCGKMVPDPRGKRESIMISCPVPGHIDKVPSAWINLDKQTWFCGGCQIGGDKFTIAGFHYGIDHDKDREKFPELKKLMAQDFGYVVKKTIGGQTLVEKADDALAPPVAPEASPPSGVLGLVERDAPGEDQASEPAQEIPDRSGAKLVSVDGGVSPARPSDSPAPLASVTPLHAVNPVLDEESGDYSPDTLYPSLDWRSIVKDDTFLGVWMANYSQDDLPDEYYFWLGMMAIGAALGNRTQLQDNPLVHGNLYVCLLGSSGQGKTRSIMAFRDLMREALPYDENDPASSGVKMIGTPGSAESLVDAFSRPVMDPADPKKTAFYAPVRGYVEFAELSALTGRAERQGSTLKPQLMELYDNNREVSIRSRGAGVTIARDPFAFMVSTTQPRAVKELITRADADSGFLNRWIFATGKPKELQALRDDNFSVTPAVAPLQKIRAWTGNGRRITFSDQSKAAFTEWFRKNILPLKRRDEPLLHRMELTAKKILLLLATNEHSDTVTLEHIEKMDTIFDYLLQAYEFLGGHIGVGKFEDCRKSIEHLIKNAPPTQSTSDMTKLRDITRMGRRKGFSSDLIVKVLETMVKLSEVEELTHKPQRGPSTQVYRWAE